MIEKDQFAIYIAAQNAWQMWDGQYEKLSDMIEENYELIIFFI